MDKIEVIRQEIESRLACDCYNKDPKEELESLLKCIDSMQEEPVSEDLGKVGSLKSLEYYPEKKTTNKTGKGVFDANMPRRMAYLRGFKDGAHAHKELIANKPVSIDLELTWEDLKTLNDITDDVYAECDVEIDEKEFYQEVLKRFKNLKK